jgi:hypothetical protein
MAKETDPLGFSETTKQALEQAHQALDTYFDFLKNSVSVFPSFGTEFGEKMKRQGVENIAAFQELVKRLSNASSFEEALSDSDCVYALSAKCAWQTDKELDRRNRQSGGKC